MKAADIPVAAAAAAANAMFVNGKFGAALGHNPTTTFKQLAGDINAVLWPNAFIAHRRAISRPHPAQHEFPGRKNSS